MDILVKTIVTNTIDEYELFKIKEYAILIILVLYKTNYKNGMLVKVN